MQNLMVFRDNYWSLNDDGDANIVIDGFAKIAKWQYDLMT